VSKYKGLIAVMLSAVIFGFTPILARITYDYGSNGINMTFLRAVLSLPVLFLLSRKSGKMLRLDAGKIIDIALLGVVGTSLTTILLYSSYNYIGVGLATTLHFVYPVISVVICALFFGESLSLWKLAALLCSVAGTMLSSGSRDFALSPGIALALLSGCTYAFYIIFMDKTWIKNMDCFQLSFLLCSVMSITSGLFGGATGTLNFRMPLIAWAYSLAVSLLNSLGAIPLFQMGVRYVGGSTASILSTLEPITGLILSAVMIGERLSWPKVLGCALILISVWLISYAENKRDAVQGGEEA
jgi:drug/metabolite transporter (DMT)-like permease